MRRSIYACVNQHNNEIFCVDEYVKKRKCVDQRMENV